MSVEPVQDDERDPLTSQEGATRDRGESTSSLKADEAGGENDVMAACVDEALTTDMQESAAPRDVQPEECTDVQPEPLQVDDRLLAAQIEALAVAYSEMSQVLTQVGARLDGLERVASRQAAYVDALHAENSSLKRGELQAAQLPLIRAMFGLYDNVLIGGSRNERNSTDINYEIVDDLADHLRGVLSIAGIEPFAPARGEPFDASRHRAVAVEDTLESSLERVISKVRRVGFVDETRVLRLADVVVFRARPQSAEPGGRGDSLGTGSQEGKNR